MIDAARIIMKCKIKTNDKFIADISRALSKWSVPLTRINSANDLKRLQLRWAPGNVRGKSSADAQSNGTFVTLPQTAHRMDILHMLRNACMNCICQSIVFVVTNEWFCSALFKVRINTLRHAKCDHWLLYLRHFLCQQLECALRSLAISKHKFDRLATGTSIRHGLQWYVVLSSLLPLPLHRRFMPTCKQTISAVNMWNECSVELTVIDVYFGLVFVAWTACRYPTDRRHRPWGKNNRVHLYVRHVRCAVCGVRVSVSVCYTKSRIDGTWIQKSSLRTKCVQLPCYYLIERIVRLSRNPLCCCVLCMCFCFGHFSLVQETPMWASEKRAR